ncbi:MAG: TIGR03960 family B12-binding radical SAM protein [Nitrospirota bacterium]
MLSSFLQKPSRYINREINAVYRDASVKVALAFPDLYEIGMSHLGLKILYKIINDLPYASAERVFSPWTDMEALMKKNGSLLSSLETHRPLKDFDIAGFSLQYELSYPTVLNMLHLGGIPVRSEDRLNASSGSPYPLIIAGGPCTVNPLPLAQFVDAFLVGDGEEAIGEILNQFHTWKTEGDRKRESLLLALSRIEGVFVPLVHCTADTHHNTALSDSLPLNIRRRILGSLDDAPYPDAPIVPFAPIVHDRINIEIARGCSMGCRFCQAGMIYRPVRERSPEKALELAGRSLKNTGYEEVSFTSLSAGDYRCLLPLVTAFNKRFARDRIALSLPSLRVASLNSDLLKEIRSVRKTGFTIAPEAGTERLRRVINKDFSEKEYEQALLTLFEEGWLNLKLYFMIGLPTETDEDIEAIPGMAMKALKIAKKYTKRFVNITIGVSPFAPKAHTPFQWRGQSAPEELKRKKFHIKNRLTKKGFNVKGHNIEMSLLEAAFSRGDLKLAELIEKAWSLGCRLDGWTDIFDYGKWQAAMDATGINAADYAARTYGYSDHLPWEIINTGVAKDFLWKEYQHALSGEISPDCRKTCHNCGIGCKHASVHEQAAGSRQSVPDLRSPVHNPAARQFKPVTIRAEFAKTGRLRFLSHLELVTLLHRAMRRAAFPLEYSKGFHPSPKVSFGPPLGVGVSGLAEYFDMEVTPPFNLSENLIRLNTLLPEGIRVHFFAAVPAGGESLNSFITRYHYEIRGGSSDSVRGFLAEREVLVQREKALIDVRNMVEEARFPDEETTRLILVDQGDKKVRLGEILPLIFAAPVEDLDITRIALFGWKSGWVKPLERSLQWTAKY